MWLFWIFVAVPILEIALFIQVGGLLGLWFTLGIVIVTALLGTVLVRGQGIAAVARIRSNLEGLRDPTEPLADGAMILAAGLLLLTPGFFTDAIGFALLTPPIRAVLFKWIKSKVRVQSFVDTGTQEQWQDGASNGETIGGDYTEIDETVPKSSNGTPSGWTKH